MDYTFNFTHLIKPLLFVSCLTLSLSVLADDKQNVIDACFLKYVDNDHKSALPLCKQAAEQGDSSAQVNLGMMYDNGRGTPKDDKQAVYWYTQAAEQGNVDAQFNLGGKHRKGKGTPKNNIAE